MDDEEDNQHKLKLLEELKKATKDLQTKPNIPIYAYTNLTAIKTFLELQTRLDTILCSNPTLFFNLSHLLSDLKNQLNSLQNSQDYGLRSFIRRLIANYEITKIAAAIEAEVRAWIDQETIKKLVQVLKESVEDEEKVEEALIRFETRVSDGFDRDLQEMILKAKVFSILESVVSKSKCSERVCEESARAVVALVRFNKDVFVGQVLMGPMISTLVSKSSQGSISVLSSLIKLIRTPLVSEMEENRYIPRIIILLSSKDLSIQAAALGCVLELGYFGRKDAVEVMLREGLIEKLVELQRLEIEESSGEARRLMEESPFTSCVTRFVVKLEMGEGLEQWEKRQLKQEILKRTREASVSEAEATTIVAEVLWGSSPLLH